MAVKTKTTKKTPTRGGKTAVLDAANGSAPVTHDEVAKTAYYFWEQRGRVHGSAEEDWFRAQMAVNTNN